MDIFINLINEWTNKNKPRKGKWEISPSKKRTFVTYRKVEGGSKTGKVNIHTNLKQHTHTHTETDGKRLVNECPRRYIFKNAFFFTTFPVRKDGVRLKNNKQTITGASNLRVWLRDHKPKINRILNHYLLRNNTLGADF